jgi:ankyrin repeat protein
VPIDARLLTGIYRGEVVSVRDALARGASPEAVEKDGFNALFYAILADNPPGVRVELVKLLVVAGTNVNHHDSDQRWTALAFAARGGHFEVCKILLAAGSNVDSTDRFGNTPLWRATFSRHKEIVALLVEYGANPDLKNDHGISPRLLAEDAGSTYFPRRS